MLTFVPDQDRHTDHVNANVDLVCMVRPVECELRRPMSVRGRDETAEHRTCFSTSNSFKVILYRFLDAAGVVGLKLDDG